MSFIPYGRQNISEADIQAVVEVLRSDFITQGPAIEAFEKAVATACGAKYAVAISNATAGLHIACLAAGLGPGDRLWTSPNTFVASANCARYCGADVDFVDIDPRTWNMSVDALALKLGEAEKTGTLPRVLVPVHFAGQSCQMREIRELAERYGVTIIEDAAHAIGGRYLGQPVGSCAYSEMTVFSFHPVKIVTTGEGGMVLTNCRDLYEKLVGLRSHGITRDPAEMQATSHGPWYYEQQMLGFNFRMTDIQAALGHSQMKRLEQFITRRHELAQRYNERLADLPIIRPWQHPDTYSAYHLYVIRLDRTQTQRTRLEVFNALREAGIGVQIHYIPVHTQPYYRELGFRKGDFPQAEAYYEEAISLPMYFALSDAEQDRVIAALQAALHVTATV